MVDTVTVDTTDRIEVQDITTVIADRIPTDMTGAIGIFVDHTTAGVCVNEPESRLLGDIEEYLTEVVPEAGWQHDEIDNNAAAHLRAMVVGNGIVVPVRDGELDLGTWQAILLVECDGPRRRSVTVTTVPETPART